MLLMKLFAKQERRHRHREETYGHGERGEEGEMYGKSNMEIILPYVKEMANRNLLYGSGNSIRGSGST